MEIACFVSPHGFGHATRTVAIIEALQRLSPNIHFHIFTTVPQSLFDQTINRFSYHHIKTDVGLEQHSALQINIPKTIASLDEFLPFHPHEVKYLVSKCTDCALVICDIAPIGIAVAKTVNIPSVLVENFTWDWIYKPHKELSEYARYLAFHFEQATYRIQTEPLCKRERNDLICGPIFRRYREGIGTIREKLGAESRKIVVITTGGVIQELPIWSEMKEMSACFFVITGQQTTIKREENILLLERETEIYHPDLINCADLVVCKTGYSTIAECYQAGTRVLAIDLDDFPESQIIIRFLDENFTSESVKREEFYDGSWLAKIHELIRYPRTVQVRENGADSVATFISALLLNF